MKFEKLPELMKNYICNGCGAKGGWVRPPYEIFFKVSCDHHDYGYWKGGNWFDKLKCDRELRRQMLADVSTLKWYQRFKYLPWAELYFIGVLVAGNPAFNYTSDRRAVCNVKWFEIFSGYEANDKIPWDKHIRGNYA